MIARFAKEEGIDIVLSGRNPHKLREQADKHGFAARPADLADSQSMQNALRDVDVVIHCAGPFAHTYEAMAKACIATNTHYTDITGETEVYVFGVRPEPATANRSSLGCARPRGTP